MPQGMAKSDGRSAGAPEVSPAPARERVICCGADLGRCFQLMEADDITLLQRWIAGWSDLMAFEIVPVVSGKDTAEALSGDL
jgi:Protein of unknown function (DUF3303)